MSRYTLLRARRNGLPFVRLGAFVCYRPEDLEAWFLAEPKRRGKRRRGAAKLADSEKEGGMESDAS
ncbi:MAG: hypothetical protein KF855_17195 [Acidobacteria bacterium]|nr:hypothetical protein [Acidobacteriota bacterium]